MRNGIMGLQRKATLRLQLLQHLKSSELIVLETHGGDGKLFHLVYEGIAKGVVLESDPEAAERLAVARPSWRCYETSAADALAAGVGADLPINFVDVDQEDGDPWPMLTGFFESEREFPLRLAVAVTDGVRQKLRTPSGWRIATLKAAREKFSSGSLHGNYLEVAKWNLLRLAAPRGYGLVEWAGFYAGRGERVSHFGAVLECKRVTAPSRAA